MEASRSLQFPLFEKASAARVLQTGNALIVAPTATGKSYIGRAILRGAVQRREPGVHVYLVPYRALAAEMRRSFECELADCPGARLKVSTGDHSDPVYPEETDILIATYERFATLLRTPELSLGRVVIDEVHLIADQTRGAVVEGLIARMKSHKRPRSLCALSAVIAEPQPLADWLGVPLILGDASDRTVKVEFCCELSDDVDSGLAAELESVLEKGEQAIIFCRSKAVAQREARDLKGLVAKSLSQADREALQHLAYADAQDDEEAKEHLELLAGGVAYHHAGLPKDSRQAVEEAFRDRHLKVIACTPTLAAGVNLPARLVVVRDVFRSETVRGRHMQVLLSTGELLNMLGRAGRPGQVESGRGVAFVKNGLLDKAELAELQVAIQEGRGNPVISRLPDSFNSLMRFLLAVAADVGETTLDDMARAVEQTFWYHLQPSEIAFDRPFRSDMMEDIPAFARVTADVRLERAWPVADGVAGSVVSGPKTYNFSLRFSGAECSCPAQAKWRRRDVCKHLALVIHELLFGGQIDPEVRSRAIYASVHLFRKTLDPGTKIREAVELLCAWDLLEPVPGGYRATAVGELAAGSGLDLLLIRSARDRVRDCAEVPAPQDVATWVVADYFGEEAKQEKWRQAIGPWLGEVDIKKIALPEKYRGSFERELDNLGQLATLYGTIADSLGKPEVAEVCRTTRGCLQYGLSPELVPLSALRLHQMGRARCRFLYDQRQVRTLGDLAAADPRQLAGPHVPLNLAQQWVETAGRMWQSRPGAAGTGTSESRREIDDFLGSFQVDQLSLFGPQGLVGRQAK